MWQAGRCRFSCAGSGLVGPDSPVFYCTHQLISADHELSFKPIAKKNSLNTSASSRNTDYVCLNVTVSTIQCYLVPLVDCRRLLPSSLKWSPTKVYNHHHKWPTIGFAKKLNCVSSLSNFATCNPLSSAQQQIDQDDYSATRTRHPKAPMLTLTITNSSFEPLSVTITNHEIFHHHFLVIACEQISHPHDPHHATTH